MSKQNVHKKYAKSLSEARKLYKLKTGEDYDTSKVSRSAIAIFRLKKGFGRTKTRNYFVGSWLSFLNL